MEIVFNKKNIYVEEYTDENYVLHEYQKKYKRNVKYRSKYWCHYTPSTFPAPPILTKQNNELCCKSWTKSRFDCRRNRQ
jgi:hypothetical protein